MKRPRKFISCLILMMLGVFWWSASTLSISRQLLSGEATIMDIRVSKVSWSESRLVAGRGAIILNNTYWLTLIVAAAAVTYGMVGMRRS